MSGLIMEIEILKVEGKIGKLYFSHCPNCKKYIVNIKRNVITCPNCRNKYQIEYPESK